MQQVESENKKIEEQLFHGRNVEELERLLSGFTHDLRNMLNSIMGYSQIQLIKMDKHSPLYQYPTKIIDICKRCTHLIKKMRIFTRFEAINKKSVDLHTIILDVLALLSKSIPETITLDHHFQAQHPLIFGASDYIADMILNLGLYAADALLGQGEILVATFNEFIDACSPLITIHEIKPGEYIALSIIDTGIGINEQTRANIFEPLLTIKESGNDIGLGLSIVQGCVKNHEGFTKVISTSGKGSNFTIYLPVMIDPALHSSEQLFDTPIDHTSPTSILLIDDNKHIIDCLSEALTLLGCTIHTFYDVNSGIAFFKASSQTIDYILLDYNMPLINGLETARQLKSICPAARIFLATGFDFSKEVEESIAREKILLGIITKPYQPQDILNAIQRDRDSINRSNDAVSPRPYPSNL